MNKEEYFKYHEDACRKLIAITKAKNSDYTGPGSDPFANFRRCEQLGICSTEAGFLTRMTDKLARVSSILAKGDSEVKTESLEDTLFDLANYSVLLAGYIKSKVTPQTIQYGSSYVNEATTRPGALP